ncbi:development-specific protein LVN1.2-like [Asterias amurensis]|uniref:development-specific protein LVN1.2-like n=1 Tax=Asterias amurensis TaxID=7602 RepID=UPI003AB39749
MKVFLVCAFVISVVGVVTSAPPSKAKFCCFPDQYEASMGEVDGYALPNGKGGVANSFSKIAVDSQNGLAATELTQIYNGTTTKLKIIINYKEKVDYVIVGETCTKAVMNEPQFRCVPDNAQDGGTFYFGDKGLDVNVYTFPLNQKGLFEGNVSLTVTRDNCIPVGTTSIGRSLDSTLAPSLPVMKTSGFVNFVIGVKDPDHWFKLPSFCPKEISERSKRSVDVNPVSGFLPFTNLMMKYEE